MLQYLSRGHRLIPPVILAMLNQSLSNVLDTIANLSLFLSTLRNLNKADCTNLEAE